MREPRTDSREQRPPAMLGNEPDLTGLIGALARLIARDIIENPEATGERIDHAE